MSLPFFLDRVMQTSVFIKSEHFISTCMLIFLKDSWLTCYNRQSSKKKVILCPAETKGWWPLYILVLTTTVVKSEETRMSSTNLWLSSSRLNYFNTGKCAWVLLSVRAQTKWELSQCPWPTTILIYSFSIRDLRTFACADTDSTTGWPACCEAMYSFILRKICPLYVHLIWTHCSKHSAGQNQIHPLKMFRFTIPMATLFCLRMLVDYAKEITRRICYRHTV